MKNLVLLMLPAFALICSCSPVETTKAPVSPLETSNLTTQIAANELVGTWNLSVMKADTGVDLDKDGTYNANLLLESTCFTNMNIVFKADMTFTTHNSKLDFNGGTTGDEFTCARGRDDFGTWSVSGDMLSLNINIDGNTYSEQKQLTYNTKTFSFEVTKSESSTYVSDPGNTSASPITILSLEYTKQ